MQTTISMNGVFPGNAGSQVEHTDLHGFLCHLLVLVVFLLPSKNQLTLPLTNKFFNHSFKISAFV
jgi:hypothetical protein